MADADRPVAELLREFSDQTTTLIRQELELARLELTEKGKRAGLGDTVEALAAKADVKGQAKRAVEDVKATVADRAANAREAIAGKAADTREATPDSAAAARQRASRFTQDNRHVLIPALALMLGILIGRRWSR